MGNDANKDIKEFTETVVEAGNAAEDTTEKVEKLSDGIAEAAGNIANGVAEAQGNIANGVAEAPKRVSRLERLKQKMEAQKVENEKRIEELTKAVAILGGDTSSTSDNIEDRIKELSSRKNSLADSMQSALLSARVDLNTEVNKESPSLATAQRNFDILHSAITQEITSVLAADISDVITETYNNAKEKLPELLSNVKSYNASELLEVAAGNSISETIQNIGDLANEYGISLSNDEVKNAFDDLRSDNKEKQEAAEQSLKEMLVELSDNVDAEESAAVNDAITSINEAIKNTKTVSTQINRSKAADTTTPSFRRTDYQLQDLLREKEKSLNAIRGIVSAEEYYETTKSALSEIKNFIDKADVVDEKEREYLRSIAAARVRNLEGSLATQREALLREWMSKASTEDIQKAIQAVGNGKLAGKINAPDGLKEIIGRSTADSSLITLLRKQLESKVEAEIKQTQNEATKAIKAELDSLKAETTDKKSAYELAAGREDRIKALNEYRESLTTYYQALDNAPEGIVSENDKANVRATLDKLDKKLEELLDSVTDEIAEVVKKVDETVKNIKSNQSLSTTEKLAQVQGAMDTLNSQHATTSGDVDALNGSKANTQGVIDNLTAQAAREATQQAKQATQQVLSSVKSIVSGIERAMNSVVSIIRRGLSLLNRAINFTINSLKSVITGAQKIIQLVGSLSNRVRSFVGNLLNANKAGERSNVIVRSVGLTFTELNSAISLVERAFNALFNNKMLERAMKFDSTIASITMLLGDEATADVRDFADALETGFGVPATKTISDLQEISSLLKGVGIQTEYIANASEDLYSMANYMAALGMAGGDVSEVMTKLQSGLKGMTQSIDDLGLSVRETQMDEFLRNNGYNVKFSGLSEANREIVRLAAIISQFRKSFNISDYPKLMKNTYFQISLVKTQIEEIGTLIGKIFEGLLKNILPFVMKAVYTIKSAVIGIGESLGIDMGFGETESQASEASAAVDEITESTKEATKAAKEYSGAAGFDKLESLSSGSSSGSGSGDTDMSSLLANVGNISDELIKIARDSDGFMDAVDKEIRKRLKKLKKDIQEYADDLLGHHVDLSFGFDKDSAKASLDGIWENIKRWWESVSETGLWLSFRFAEDIQIGRLSNDLLSIIESITKIVAVIQEALEPVIKKLYDEYLSPIVKDIGDGIHNFADGLAGLADVIEAMFSGDKSLADVKKMIDDLAETHPKFAALADDILTIKENWQGFIDIWNGKDTKKAKKLEEAFPVITQLEKTIKSITELTSTLWSDYLKPLFRHIKKNMPTPEQLLKNLQDAVDKINEVLGKDSTKITITDAASSVLQIITNKAKALKKVLKSIGKVAISLITPTDENGNVASKEDGGSSVLSLLADSMSNFVDNEFTEWLDEVTDDLTKFIQENKEDIVKVIDDLRDFAWDAFKTVIEKIIKLFKWVVTHEEDVKKVLNTINRAFRFVVNNAEALISVFVALKGLQKIASGATAIVSVLKAIKKLKGLSSVEEEAGAKAASIISTSTIKIAGKATLIIGTALLGYEIGKEFGETFLDIGERLADLKTKNDDKAMTALLSSLYAESTTGTIESMKEAQDQLMRDFKLTVEDLKPFEYKDKYGIPQLDMSRLSVDGVGTVRTVASNGSVVLAKAYEDVEAELAKSTQKQEAEEKKVKDREKRNSRTSAQKIADGVNGVPSSISEMSKDIVDAIKTAGKESRKKSLTALEAIRDGIGGIPSGVKDTVKELKGINTILGSALNPDTGGKATATEEEKKGKAAIKAREDKEKTKRKEARALLKSPKTTEAISENPKLILKYLDAFKVEKQKKIKEAVNAYTLSIKNAKDSREVDSALKTFKASLHELKIPGFKRGGSIGKGSLFIANENGSATELIGNITKRSGTDVANNKMITDAMEVAVYNGFAEAFNQMQTNNVNSNQTQTINISGFGMIDKTTLKKLAQLLTPYLDATNKSLITT